MTDLNQLKALRIVAKHLARSGRTALHKALDLVAAECGHPHWNALTLAWRKGWRPTCEQLKALGESSSQNTEPRMFNHVDESNGSIAGKPYHLEIDLTDVVMHGKGWAIHLGHAPSEPPEIETYVSPNPLDDEMFRTEAMKIANAAADRLREAISRDWPRRSTKPDKDGRVQHPLFGSVSAEWHCLHCDARSSGEQMASNMWHCPQCSAAPIDMHITPRWKGEADLTDDVRGK